MKLPIKYHDGKRIETIRATIRASARRYSGRTAIMQKFAGSYREISYAELLYKVEGLGTELLERGFLGKKVIIYGESCLEWATVFLAAVCGLSVAVAKICIENGIPYYPGCVTPTEIMQALELGITTVKFFPANVYGGLSALKALSGPFPQVKFIPTGGVDRSNIDEFLAFDKIVAIGGSFFVKEALEKMEADK